MLLPCLSQLCLARAIRTRRPRPRGISPPTAPAAPSAALPTPTRTGPRSPTLQSGGGSRTALPSGTTVSCPSSLGLARPAKPVTDSPHRQEAQETPGRSREARRLLVRLPSSDARRDPTIVPAGRQPPAVQAESRDSTAPTLAPINAQPVHPADAE